MEKNKILILGASGLVGRYLKKELDYKKYKTLGTYNSNSFPELFYFDLKKDFSKGNFLSSEKFDFAIICSAMTKIDECFQKKELSNSINIDGTKNILNYFREKKIFPIFISGAIVFDGKGGYKEEDARNPLNLYGLQKLKIEDFIMENFNHYLIIRPGKIFGKEKKEGIFSDWIDKFNKKEKMFCATDEYFSLVYAGDLARGVETLISKRKEGIYHISPMEVYNRFDLANNFFNFLDIKANINKCSIKKFETLEKRSCNSFIDSSKFIKENNFKFTNLNKLYLSIFENNSLLARKSLLQG